MELLDETGDGFACGCADFRIGAAKRGGDSERFLIQAKFDDFTTEVFLDTGAPYSGIVTMNADPLVPDEADPKCEATLKIRGKPYSGYLYPLPIVLLATSGQDLEIEGTVFLAQDDYDDDFLPFLGLTGCLERVRFAIDPVAEKFYFGEAG